MISLGRGDNMESFSMFYGERVRNVGDNPLYKGKEGEVVGGDEHNIVVKWDDLPRNRHHKPYEILWLHKGE